MPYIAIEDALKPLGLEELQTRAVYLTKELGQTSSRQLREYIDHCDAALHTSTDSGSTRSLASQLGPVYFNPAVKELLCLNLWLLFIEVKAREAQLPEWFRDLLILCHAVADKIYVKPSAQEIKQKYLLDGAPPELCMQASINLCMQLDLGNTRDDALIYLGSLLERDLDKRSHALASSLTDPLEKIVQVLKLKG